MIICDVIGSCMSGGDSFAAVAFEAVDPDIQEVYNNSTQKFRNLGVP